MDLPVGKMDLPKLNSLDEGVMVALPPSEDGDRLKAGLVSSGDIGGSWAARLGSGIRSLIKPNHSALVFHLSGVPARRHRRCYGGRGSGARARSGQLRWSGLTEPSGGAAVGAKQREGRPGEAETPMLAPTH